MELEETHASGGAGAAPRVLRGAVVAVSMAALLLTSACSGDDDPAGAASSTSAASDASTAPSGGATPLPTPSTPDGPPASTAPVVGATTLPPVVVGSPAPFGDGLVATVTSVRQVQVEGGEPGQVAGPAVAVTMELRNGTTERVDAGGVVVDASYGDGQPADPTTAAPSAPATGTIDPGASTRGTWVFSAPAGAVDSLVLTISSLSSASTVVVRA